MTLTNGPKPWVSKMTCNYYYRSVQTRPSFPFLSQFDLELESIDTDTMPREEAFENTIDYLSLHGDLNSHGVNYFT